MDKYSIGVVTQHEFKFATERTLGYKMADKQWEELKENVGLDQDGLVPFPKFLESFSTRLSSTKQLLLKQTCNQLYKSYIFEM